MRLKVMVPEKVLLEKEVEKITARALDGSFCLLPLHIDFVTVLAPGVLSFENNEGRIEYVAVDSGVLVKNGSEVLVSTRNAEPGTDLQKAREAAARFLAPREQEELARAVMVSWEKEFSPMYLKAG